MTVELTCSRYSTGINSDSGAPTEEIGYMRAMHVLRGSPGIKFRRSGGVGKVEERSSSLSQNDFERYAPVIPQRFFHEAEKLKDGLADSRFRKAWLDDPYPVFKSVLIPSGIKLSQERERTSFKSVGCPRSRRRRSRLC
jgi:hypothetical protein